MEWSFVFFLNSVLLGVGLAMDAFSVSMANGLHDPKMNKGTMCKIAGTFGLFQAAMPMIGWVCVHTIVELFASFETLIPWIALALLGYIGGKMLLDGIRVGPGVDAMADGMREAVWADVRSRIRRRGIRMQIVRYAAAAAVMAGVVCGSWFMGGRRTESRLVAAAQPVSVSTPLGVKSDVVLPDGRQLDKLRTYNVALSFGYLF